MKYGVRCVCFLLLLLLLCSGCATYNMHRVVNTGENLLYGVTVQSGEKKFGHGYIPPGRTAGYRGRMKINLTDREFDLMVHFAKNPGRVFSRAELLDAVWGNDRNVFEHTVNSQVNRLRAKIEKNPATPRVINTVWGVGYKFEA